MLLLLGLMVGASQEGEPDASELFRAGASAPRTQALEPGYRVNASRPKYIDRLGVSDLALGANDALHAALRDDGGDAWAVRAIKYGLSFWFGVACSHVVHEYGHMCSLSRAGFNEAMLGPVGASGDQKDEATLPRLFAQGMWPSEGRALSLKDEDWAELQRRFEGRPADFNRFWLTVEAGGLNQEQVFVSRYARRLREDRLSFLDTPVVLWGAAGTLMYSATIEESDIADYLERLSVEGRESSASELKALSALRFLGGTGLASLRGGVQGLFGSGGGAVEPFSTELGDGVRVFWPEVESYLTRCGPTLKLDLPVCPGGWTLLPSYERAFASGGEDHEGGLRVRAPFFDSILWLEAAFYVSDQGGQWRSAEAELRPLAWLSLLVGTEGGRGYTFRRDVYGSRDSYLDGSERSLLLGLRLSWAF